MRLKPKRHQKLVREKCWQLFVCEFSLFLETFSSFFGFIFYCEFQTLLFFANFWLKSMLTYTQNTQKWFFLFFSSLWNSLVILIPKLCTKIPKTPFLHKKNASFVCFHKIKKNISPVQALNADLAVSAFYPQKKLWA